MFHCLARTCADLMIGGSGADRSHPAWTQVYRALEHGAAAHACRDNKALKQFPKEIEDFGNAFIALQNKRHSADYDPSARYFKSSVEQDIDIAASAIANLLSASARDRRAFAAFVLFKRTRK